MVMTLNIFMHSLACCIELCHPALLDRIGAEHQHFLDDEHSQAARNQTAARYRRLLRPQDRRSLSLAGRRQHSRDAAVGRRAAGLHAQHSRQAARPRPAARSHRAAARDRQSGRHAGRRRLLLPHASRRQAEPAGAVCSQGRRRQRRSSGRRQPAVQGRHGRARLVVCRRTTASTSLTARRRAARR